jgi:acetyl esterase/lipase
MTNKDNFRCFDVVYEPEVNLLARLYLPIGAPVGAMVDIHGGAWVSGDRHDNAVIAHALAAAGVVVMSPDFRMPPGERYPAPVADIHLAIRWLKSILPTFGLARERMGGLGTSSGAHQLLLATLLANDRRYAALQLPDHFGRQNASLSFLVLCWPRADPLKRYRMVLEQNNKQLIDAHHAYWPDEASMVEGNPQSLLDSGELGSLPSALVLQGTADENLPQDSADQFAASYRNAGGKISLSLFKKEPHAFITRHPECNAAQTATNMIVDFAIREASKPRP